MTDMLGDYLNPWLVLPFVAFLLCIAVLPLAAPEWFEKLRNKAILAAVFGVPVLVYLMAMHGTLGREKVIVTFEDYVSFIVLLLALFSISGGVFLTGDPLGTPRNNVRFLLVGAVLANFVGTTGAAMLLVRPMLRANSERTHIRHIFLFLILVVCNAGGLLTPLGDPPLFLGFLQGVSFTWTLRLWPQWVMVVGFLLVIFYFIDRHYYAREPREALIEDVLEYVPLRLLGKVNILFLGGVIAAVVLSEPLRAVGEKIHFSFLPEIVMLAMVALSLRLGPRQPREMNKFTWGPIGEVAIVFAGIFATMVPALSILQARGEELGLTTPWEYFWSTGILSSFLDNAPTYLTFTSAAKGYLGVQTTAGLMSPHVGEGFSAAPAAFLAAISCGAVFMGANSYIGNAPNFMVKSIAEEQGVPMPHFFGYMAWSAVIMLPVFALVTVVFFV